VALLQRRALGRYVAIVEGEEGHAELVEELEGVLQLLLRALERVARGVPRAIEGARAEDVGARPREGVPVTDRRSELLLHRLAEHDALAVVVAIGERVGGVGAFVPDGLDVFEIALSHGFASNGD